MNEGLLKPREVEKEEWQRQAARCVKICDRKIRLALAKLSYCHWPAQYLLGVIPLKNYHLRYQQVDPQIHLWWMEQTLPSRNNLPKIYRIQLVIDPQARPVLTVQSGDFVYPVLPLTVKTLAEVIARAGCDSPLICPQWMPAKHNSPELQLQYA